jgi:hypothetical protein
VLAEVERAMRSPPQLEFGHFQGVGRLSRGSLGSEMPPLVYVLGCGVAPD